MVETPASGLCIVERLALEPWWKMDAISNRKLYEMIVRGAPPTFFELRYIVSNESLVIIVVDEVGTVI